MDLVLHREGTDRTSLETAIEILIDASRPLIIFPEGQTFRTNDLVRPPLDGVGFIARTAAKRRHKLDAGSVVVHPVAIKYIATQDASDWLDQQLTQMEKHFGWQKKKKADLISRTLRVSDSTTALYEIDYFGEARCGEMQERRDKLRDHLLQDAEQQLGINAVEGDDTGSRVRTIRSSIVSTYFDDEVQKHDREQLYDLDLACEIAHQLHCYNDYAYLSAAEVTQERLIETVQRHQENLVGKVVRGVPMKAVMQCGEAITVPTEKAPRRQTDPLLVSIQDSLAEMIAEHPGRAIR